MMKFNPFRSLRRVSLLIPLLIPLGLTIAISPTAADDELIPDDTCYVDLELPPGATVRVGKKDHGGKRRITFQPLTPGKPYKTKFTITFADGQTAERDIVLRGGWRTRLPVRPTDSARPEPLLQVGHKGDVRQIAFSPDGARVLTASDDNTAIVWDTRTGQTLLSLQGHSRQLRSAAFRAEGKQIVTCDFGGAVIVWSADSGKQLRSFEVGTFSERMNISSDGRFLICAGRDYAKYPSPKTPEYTGDNYDAIRKILDANSRKTPREINLWDVDAGKRVRSLVGHVGDVESISISLSSRRAVTASENGVVYVWDLSTGRVLRSLRGHRGDVRAVALTPDGRRAISAGDDKLVILWNIDSGARLHAIADLPANISAVAINSNGSLAASAGYGVETTIWDVESGARSGLNLEALGPAYSLAFDSSGKLLAIGRPDGSARVIDLASGSVSTLQGNPANPVMDAAMSSDGDHAVAGHGDGSATIWDLENGRLQRTLRGHDSKVSAVDYSPDGRQILTASWDDTAVVWAADSGEKIREFRDLVDSVEAAAFDPIHGRVAFGTRAKRILIYDQSNGKRLWSIPNGNDWVNTLAFSPDGRRIATVRKASVRIWDLPTGQQLQSMPMKATFLNDQKQELEIDQYCRTVSYSSDGHKLLVASIAGSAMVYEATSGRRLNQWHFNVGGHAVAFNDFRCSSDGRMALAAIDEHEAFVWSMDTGTILHSFVGHTGPVNSAEFVADGGRVLTASDDGTMRLWDVATGDELARMMTFNKGADWLVVTPEGFFDGSEAGRQMVSWRIPSAGQVVPVERFFQDFYRPGLLAEVHGGGRPLPEVELGESLPPRVRIVSPERSGPTDNQQVTVEVEVADGGGGIQGPWLRHNGARVASAGQAIKEGQTVRQTFTVSLVEGDNRLRVEAASADGSWESEPALLTLNYTQTLEKPELYIVAVGVNDYAEPSLKLSFAARDARDMVQVFSRRAAKLYEQTHVTELIDGQATKEAIRGALTDVAAKAQPQDALLVFLSGHGFTVGQRYYFIPPEFQKQSERIEDDVRRDGYAIDELGDAFRAVPALKRMLVLDTCNSGAAIAQSTQKGRNPFAFQGAIERLSRAQGIFTLAAAAATDDTVEVQELEHGVLTYSLLAGLRAVNHGPLADKWVQPDNAEQVVGVLEWFNFATGQVPRLTRQYTGQAQDVQMSGEGTSFPVLPLEE